MHGHPRRIADPNTYLYLRGAGIVGMNQFMTINAFLLGLVQLIFVYNFVNSLFFGPRASENPWHANTLEWSTPSPPAHYNFARIPTVYHAAYEYSIPGLEDDYLPQTRPRPASAPPLDPVMA
jgi:cytochrome c oxidase subunit 1